MYSKEVFTLRRNGLRPAFAGITYNENQNMKKVRDGITFSTSEANDFNSFASPSGPKKKKKAPSKDTTIEISARSLVIAIVSILAAIVLIVLVSILVASASKNIKYDDNTYLCYEDENGTYVILKNGKPIRDVFVDKTTLTPASDNSFAYITVDTAEGYDVYLLSGSRAKLICDNAESIQAYAEFEPALVYIKDDRSVYYYDGADAVITTGSGTATNVTISPDASAVAYNAPSRSNPDVSALFLYTIAEEKAEQLSAGGTSVIPVTVSDKGKYVLAYTVNSSNKEQKELYVVLNGKTSYPITELNGYFGEVLYKNSSDTEIVFTTTDENGTNHTYVFNCKKLSTKKDNTAHYLGTGKSIPQITDGKIVRLDSIKKSYFRNVEESKTFYVNKKYETLAVADFIGEFDPELEYFYFINEQKKLLCKMEIKNGKSKSISPIEHDVESFAVTEKGNVYYLDAYFDLFYYKNSQDKSIRISSDVESIQLYQYKNTLYIGSYDNDDFPAVYSSSEGSDRELAQFGGETPAKIPTITNVYSKCSYAYYEDKSTDSIVICYTSNGRTFKKVATTSNLITK